MNGEFAHRADFAHFFQVAKARIFTATEVTLNRNFIIRR